jgi:flagellar protein FlgJ
MDLGAINSKPNTANIPLEQLAANPNVSDRDKVLESCRQFEAVFLRQIMAEARKSSLSSGGEQQSATNGIYDDMVNNQMADDISRSGAFGLAKSLQAQLVKQVLPTNTNHASEISAKIKPS